MAPRIRVEITSSLAWVYVITNSFIMKPVRGGRPPKDRMLAASRREL